MSPMRNWRLWGVKWLKAHLLSPGQHYRPRGVDCLGRAAEAWESLGDLMALRGGDMGITQDAISETQGMIASLEAQFPQLFPAI